MQNPEKNKQTVIDMFKSEGFEAGLSKLNLSYRDQSLEKLKQDHRELTLRNHQLNQKIEELLKESHLS